MYRKDPLCFCYDNNKNTEVEAYDNKRNFHQFFELDDYHKFKFKPVFTAAIIIY